MKKDNIFYDDFTLERISNNAQWIYEHLSTGEKIVFNEQWLAVIKNLCLQASTKNKL